MPSVATMAEGQLLVAEDALLHQPNALISSAKRCITRNQELISSGDGRLELLADEVIGAILSELAARARLERLPVTSEGSVRLGCPAMWDAGQRLRLLTLAEKAGFRVGPATLIDEPISAGIHWVGEQARRGQYMDQERVLVFDMGGGTLDVALLDVTTGPGRDPELFVLASDGLDEAGDALDTAIASDLERELSDRGISLGDLPNEAVARAFLLRGAREAKEALSGLREVQIQVGYRAAPLPDMTYSVEALEEALRPQMEHAWELVLSTLRASYLTRMRGAVTSELRRMSSDDLTAGIAHVLLAGGMSRTPGVAKFLGARLPGARIHAYENHAGQEAIAAGLADGVSYEQVNLHRPAFDFLLEFPDGAGGEDSVVLYRAHTRFYAPWETTQRERLFYEWPGGATAVDPAAVRRLPRHGRGRLSVLALDGTRVSLRHDGQDYDSLEISFGLREPRFTLSPDGAMRFSDGRGTEHSLRIARWPALSSGFARLALPVEAPNWTPMRQPWWATK